MSTSLISAWKKNLFSNPFQVKCENGENGEAEALAVNEERTIAAAATDESEIASEMPESEPAPPELDFEAASAAEPELVEMTSEAVEMTSEAVEMTSEAVEMTSEPAEFTPEPVEVTPEPVEVTPEPVEIKPVPVEVTPEPVKVKSEPVAVKTRTTKAPSGLPATLPSRCYIENGVIMERLSTIPCNSSVWNRRYEEHSCEFGSGKYYALCAFGGLLSCGLTHTAVVPLDLVKCRIQVDAAKYGNIIQGFRVTLAEEGVRALGKGWAPTLVGYSMQGIGKFGFYEAFKILYSGMLGEENTYLWRTSLYLAASASAEFFADIALCPMEAVKVRIQTQPGWSTTLREGFPRIMQEEGISGFYKGLVPLWARQIPYTMMKFACFERTVEALYKHVVPKPRADCTKSEQLVVTFAAGYIAGVFCAIVSHPADTIVSKLNQDKGSNFMQIAQRLGFMGMWKGLFPRIIMIGTLTALQWFIYDSVKVAFRLPRPPPPEMPESLKKKMGIA